MKTSVGDDVELKQSPALFESNVHQWKILFYFSFRENDSALEVLNRMGFQTKISARERLVIH